MDELYEANPWASAFFATAVRLLVCKGYPRVWVGVPPYYQGFGDPEEQAEQGDVPEAPLEEQLARERANVERLKLHLRDHGIPLPPEFAEGPGYSGGAGVVRARTGGGSPTLEPGGWLSGRWVVENMSASFIDDVIDEADGNQLEYEVEYVSAAMRFEVLVETADGRTPVALSDLAPEYVDDGLRETYKYYLYENTRPYRVDNTPEAREALARFRAEVADGTWGEDDD